MENTQEIIKVTRGRPRKPKPIEDLNADTVEKRGRGRPRKYPKQEDKPKKEIYLWRDDRQLYFRLYYQNRKKEECLCPHCGNEFDSKRNLNGHLYKSVMCKKNQRTKNK